MATQIDSNIYVTLVDVIFLPHNIQNLPNICRGMAQTIVYILYGMSLLLVLPSIWATERETTVNG